MTGDLGAQFNLVVTTGADFNTQPNNQYPSAQDITATELRATTSWAVCWVTSDLRRHRLLLGQRERRRQSGVHHLDSGRRPWRVRQQSGHRAAALRSNGNLVAIAAGNAPDGRNSVIDFTVPRDAGTWTIAVTRRRIRETYGEYGLLATGATGALSSFFVTGTTPAAGALVQPPTDIIVTFNDPVIGLSLTPGELEVNGVSATAVTLVNANTVTGPYRLAPTRLALIYRML